MRAIGITVAVEEKMLVRDASVDVPPGRVGSGRGVGGGPATSQAVSAPTASPSPPRTARRSSWRRVSLAVTLRPARYRRYG